MSKVRFLILLITFAVVLGVGTIVFMYARGWRLNSNTKTFTPNGLLVIKSNPDGAQVFINGELKTATNATVPLAPETYDVSVRKEGYYEWKKRLSIEKEVVTESTAHLFKTVPSLSAITFSGISNIIPSPDLSKLAYTVPPTSNSSVTTETSEGLWVMDTINLPLGFSKEPKRITDGNLIDATWHWSPNGREILLTTAKGVYLLNAFQFTPQTQRINVAESIDKILAEWEQEEQVRLTFQMRKLPDELASILKRKATEIVFSPDEDMVLYTASGSATIPPNLKQQLPGSSTQKQERDIIEDKTYVYDIEEDRNFLIDENSDDLVIKGGTSSVALRRLTWFSTSRHLVLAEPNRITIIDYDSTNRQVVYSGVYTAPHAYPTLSLDQLIILTNLGANFSPANLYSLSLK